MSARWGCGYAGRVLLVDLTAGRSTIEPLDHGVARRFLGGRGLNMRVLYDEVTPGVHPLSPENRLMFATGPLVGTHFPGACRVNVSARSPLTGILGDSNAGGFFGPELKYAGFDQVIIQGRAPRPVYLLSPTRVLICARQSTCGAWTYGKPSRPSGPNWVMRECRWEWQVRRPKTGCFSRGYSSTWPVRPPAPGWGR